MLSYHQVIRIFPLGNLNIHEMFSVWAKVVYQTATETTTPRAEPHDMEKPCFLLQEDMNNETGITLKWK